MLPLLFFVSCSHELEIIETPSDLIPRDTFEMVLHDMLLLETYTKQQHKNVNDFYILMKRSAQPIFESYNIDSVRYHSSMKYYSQKQEELIEIYQSILDGLEELKPDSLKVVEE